MTAAGRFLTHRQRSGRRVRCPAGRRRRFPPDAQARRRSEALSDDAVALGELGKLFERRVVVGPKQALAVGAARLSGINWLGEAQRDGLGAKVRSMARPAPVRFDGEAIHFETPEYGVAPGQAAVIYQGERVLGGGWIDETVPAELLTA